MQKASKRAIVCGINRACASPAPLRAAAPAASRSRFSSGRRLAGYIRRAALLLIAFTVCVSFVLGCAPSTGGNTEPARREVFAMDTYMNVICYGKDAEASAEAAINEIERIDALLSIESESGSVRRVNDAGSAAIDRETELIVEQALEIFSSTGGAFDITVLPLMELWGFTSGNFRVPERSEIDAALDRVGSGKLALTNGALSLGGAAGIDLGGIAKGYTSDRLMELLRSRGIESACVSLGGNVQCLGAKPDGSAWRCGIVHPFKKDGGEYLGIIAVKDKAVITSGAYERNFTDKVSGKLYHHIIDPKTGYPAESDLSSVTIVSESGILADALSTACYIMGLEGAIEYWRSGAQSFDMILMNSDGSKVYITPALADAFSTDCMLEIISRG